jgi:hypothetical protein
MTLTKAERKDRLPHGGVSRIAEKLGVKVSAVSMVLNGHRRNRAIEVAIARMLRMKVADVFPEWYGAKEKVA